jgi:VIT1/CCC1 family predicted Fe2+/Mn2+ transporter
MSTNKAMQRIETASTRLRANLVGAYYLLTVLTCSVILFFHGSQALVVHVIVTIVYLGITAFLYGVSKPVLSKPGRKQERDQPCD